MDEIIIKYLIGSASVEEKGRLHAWLAEGDDNLSRFTEIKNLWAIFSMEKRNGSLNIDDKFKQFEQRIGRQIQKSRLTIPLWRKLQRVAAILMIPLLISTIYFVLTKRELPSNSHFVSEKQLYTPMGVKAKILLPDSTVVWLNSGSSVIYPEQFNSTVRNVKLTGEAYFDVTENKEIPFIVETESKLHVKVYGTEFNVSAYIDDPNVVTTLVDGKVSLSHPERGGEYMMKPELQVDFNNKSKEMKVSRVETKLFTDWRHGKLIFRNTPMSELIKKVERWYGVKIYIQDARVLGNYYTATFTNENIIQVMELLQKSSRIKYHIKKTNVYINYRN